jgi:hypothetical protein
MKEKAYNEKAFELIYSHGLPRLMAKILMLIKESLSNPPIGTKRPMSIRGSEIAVLQSFKNTFHSPKNLSPISLFQNCRVRIKLGIVHDIE